MLMLLDFILIFHKIKAFLPVLPFRNKQVTTGTVIELVGLVLKNSVFNKTYKQMAVIERKIFMKVKVKLRYIYIYIYIHIISKSFSPVGNILFLNEDIGIATGVDLAPL